MSEISLSHLKIGTNKLTKAAGVLNALANTFGFAFNSSSENYGPTFKGYKAIVEWNILKVKIMRCTINF